jgi:hypothetical protein
MEIDTSESEITINDGTFNTPLTSLNSESV